MSPLSATNFPKEGAFEDELAEVRWGPQAEQDAWDRLVELTRFRGQREQNIGEVLEILARTPVSISEQPLLASARFPTFTWLNDYGVSSTAAVSELIEEGRQEAAYDEYLKSWNIVRNMLAGEGPNSLIQHLVAVHLGDALADFYLEHGAHAGLATDERLHDVASEVRSRLDDSLLKALSSEYLTVRHTLVDHAQEACEGGRSQSRRWPFGCRLLRPWPFYDGNKSLMAYHDAYAGILEAIGEPAYRDRNSALEAIQSEFHCGSGSGIQSVPLRSEIACLGLVWSADGVDGLKVRLAILGYVLSASESGSYAEAPTSPLTGKPFQVTVRSDTLEVESGLESRDGEPIDYLIKKAPH